MGGRDYIFEIISEKHLIDIFNASKKHFILENVSDDCIAKVTYEIGNFAGVVEVIDIFLADEFEDGIDQVIAEFTKYD